MTKLEKYVFEHKNIKNKPWFLNIVAFQQRDNGHYRYFFNFTDFLYENDLRSLKDFLNEMLEEVKE